MKKSIILFFLISVLGFSQENGIYLYPAGQVAYFGGKQQMYKDLHKNLVEHNFEKCKDTLQHFKVALIIKKDASISIIRNTDDSLAIAQNKCAYDLAKKVLPYLKNWKPAIYQNQKTAAIYEFDFIPNDLFENYEEDYIGIPIQKNQVRFPGGINEFRNKFSKEFNLSGLDSNEKINCQIKLSVNSKGEMFDISANSTPHNSDFEKSLLSALKKIKTKWIIPKGYDLSKKPFNFTLNFNLQSQ